MASKAIQRGNILEGSQSQQDRGFILSPRRSPRSPDFPHCSRPTSPRYSVLAGFPGCAWHLLLLVQNMGRFPELTPVRRQTTEAWLPTPGASDIWNQWMDVYKPQGLCGSNHTSSEGRHT